MRALYYWGLPLVLCLAACGQREVEAPAIEKVPAREFKVHFTTGTVTTRTAFGEAVEDAAGRVTYPVYWTAGDRSVMISLNYESAVTAGVNADKTDAAGNVIRASFDASFSDIDTSNPYRFYLVSPATALVWPSADRQAVSFQVPGNQTPTALSIDEAAQILVAQSADYAAIPASVEVDFDHITAYGKLTLKNLPLPEGVTVASVSLWSEEQPLAGSWYYRFADGAVSAKEPSSSLVLDARNIDVAAGDPVWFACAPVGLGGKPLRISANLSNGKALVRTITLNQNVSFSSGVITRFSVSMANAELVDQDVMVETEETVYQLVTSINSLHANDEVILVNTPASPNCALKAGSIAAVSSSETAFTVGSDGYIRVPAGSSVAVMTVASLSGSSMTLKNGSVYLGYSNGALAWNGSATPWSASISGTGNATLTYRTNKTTYYIRYSNNNFSLNTSSASVALYKKATVTSAVTVDLSAVPVLQYTEYGAYLTDRVLAYNASTDQLSREYESDGTLTFAILAPVEEQVLEFSGIPADAVLGEAFTLRLTFISGITTELDASYNVVVAKEDGPTLYLADGSGNGFIVKR